MNLVQPPPQQQKQGGRIESSRYPPIRMFLSSECADYSHGGSLRFNLQQAISCASSSDVDIYIELSDFIAPNNAYNVNTNNNKLYIETMNQQRTITIDPGNYTVTTLISALNIKLNEEYGAGNTFTFEFNDTTNKIKMKSTNMINDFIIRGGDRFSSTYPKSILHVLGLEYNTTAAGHTSTETLLQLKNEIEGTKPCDLSGNNSFFFCVQNLSTGNYNFMEKGQGRTCSALHKVQIGVDQSSVLFFENFSGYKSRISERTITYLDILLLDEDFYPMLDSDLGKWTATISLFFYQNS